MLVPAGAVGAGALVTALPVGVETGLEEAGRGGFSAGEEGSGAAGLFVLFGVETGATTGLEEDGAGAAADFEDAVGAGAGAGAATF